MRFVFDGRLSDSRFVEMIWRTRSEGSGSFTSTAASHWEIVVTKQKNVTTVSLRGPETKASPAPIPEDAEFFGIVFKHGAFMPHLPVNNLVDGAVHLPAGVRKSFWLHGSTWELPDYENADTFVDRLVRQGLLVHDGIVDDVLRGHPPTLSIRSVRRRFLRATGLTYGTLFQIERAHRAATLLEQGVSILDTVEQAGYFDQSHLSRALRRFIGQTPAQILRNKEVGAGSVPFVQDPAFLLGYDSDVGDHKANQQQIRSTP
jgi:AraC-like DNA-binding protein